MEVGHRGQGVVRKKMIKVWDIYPSASCRTFKNVSSSRCVHDGYEVGYCWACCGGGV